MSPPGVEPGGPASETGDGSRRRDIRPFLIRSTALRPGSWMTANPRAPGRSRTPVAGLEDQRRSARRARSCQGRARTCDGVVNSHLRCLFATWQSPSPDSNRDSPFTKWVVIHIDGQLRGVDLHHRMLDYEPSALLLGDPAEPPPGIEPGSPVYETGASPSTPRGHVRGRGQTQSLARPSASLLTTRRESNPRLLLGRQRPQPLGHWWS